MNPDLRWTTERERKWADDGDVCSVPNCGITFDDQGWLIDITVLTSPGEEGYAEVTQWFCQQHYEEVAPKLAALGFMSHNHHATNLLDAEICGGYGKCPHPVEYGPELVLPYEPGTTSTTTASRRGDDCADVSALSRLEAVRERIHGAESKVMFPERQISDEITAIVCVLREQDERIRALEASRDGR